MPKLARKKKSNLPVKKASKTKQRFKAPLLGVNEKLAFKFFKTLGVWWQEKRGFYADLIPPQRRWFPEELRSDPQKLGWWFFCVAIPMRGGINSDDAFRFVYELYRDRPDLFNPYVAMYMEPEEIAGATEKVAMRIHPCGSQGEKQKGTFSYQSYQHERIWIHNAKVLVEHWGADLRNVFEGALDFEKAFAKIDHKRSKKGFRGMRRKIFSLMTTWLIEFGLVPDFQLPLIIDFHAMRLLLMHEIIQVKFSELGQGKPRDPLRIRPESMWKHAAVHISEPFVDQVIFWTLAFLKKYKRLLPCQYDIAHGKWFLSRVLCPDYYGNRSFEQKHEDGKRRGLTERLVYGKGWRPYYISAQKSRAAFSDHHARYARHVSQVIRRPGFKFGPEELRRGQNTSINPRLLTRQLNRLNKKERYVTTNDRPPLFFSLGI